MKTRENKPEKGWPAGWLILLLIAAAPCSLKAEALPVDPSMSVPAVNELIRGARPGDTLLFLPGTYTGPFLLEGVHGEPERPVVLTGTAPGARETSWEDPAGEAGGAVIDGKTEPGEGLSHHAFLLRDCSWIVIENFTIRNCWTDLVRAEETSYLTLRGCDMHGGKRALLATGRGSHHFLVEHCTWEQEERVWTHADGYSWEELHHGIHGHYNGSLYQGSGTSGVFVLRDNLVRNTFNAFRVSPVNDGEVDLVSCTNGEICRNTVINTSDNVLEPEVYAFNLHFYHNRMINGHAFISLTGVSGGEIRIYGNTAVSLPGSGDGWTVFKISGTERALTRPLYIYNNSWHVDFDIIGSPRRLWRNDHIRHFNNAVFMEQGDAFGIYHLGKDNFFDHDCSNLPFPGWFTGRGHEKNGLVADPLFSDPERGDFRPEAHSPCIDRGMRADELILHFEGSAPDIGAYDQGKLIEGRPFRFMEPEAPVPYKERPRITRHRFYGDTLMLWFSVPLSGSSVSSARFWIGGREGSGFPSRELQPDPDEGGFCLRLSGLREGDPGGRELLPSGWPAGTELLPSGWPAGLELMVSRLPEGTNGMPLTSWASEVLVRQSDRVPGPDPGRVLELTRMVAEKVLGDTEYRSRLVPLTFNAGLSQVRIEEYGGELRGKGGVLYAAGNMHSEMDTAGWLGLSFEGGIRLFLNGTEIFSGTSPSVRLQEYTYDRFQFQERIPVRWEKGFNELLVKFRQREEPSQVLLLPLDHMDAQAGYVRSVAAAAGMKDPGSGGDVLAENPEDDLAEDPEDGPPWLISGPWQTDRGDAMQFPFPPETGFAPFYGEGDNITGWRAATVPVVRELVIPEDAAYLRDAYADWHYANGATMLGILALYQVSGDDRYLDFSKDYREHLLRNLEYFRWQYFTLHAMRGSFHRVFRMTMLDDSGGPALGLAQLRLLDPGDAGGDPLLSEVLDYVMHGQQRMPDGTFCRPEPVDSTVWADDLFMSVPFLLRMAEVTGDSTLYDEAVRQVTGFARYLEDPLTGLWFHGWYGQKKEHSPVRWGRANGWVAWAVSETLLRISPSHPGYQAVLDIYSSHMEALARYQAPSGMWHQVLDHPETYQETSCTALFTLAMARGVRHGWLSEGFREPALRGWNALEGKIGEDGTVKDICRGTGIGESVEFYQSRQRFDHDPRGLGGVMTAGCEVYRMLREMSPAP